MIRVGLRNFQLYPDRASKYAGRQVRVWSAEHNAFWCRNERGGGAGYAGRDRMAEAGVWVFQDALQQTDHCGPEKRIWFEFVTPGDLGEEARAEADWHEDFGAVLWWRFPIDEAPYVGSPLYDDWPGYHTHWTPLPPIPHKPPRRPAHRVCS